MIRLLTLVFAMAGMLGAAIAKPRAVSLDYCADQYLLQIAAPDQILAVSRGADEDYSRHRDRAAPFQKIRATPEEALSLEPKLVLRQWGGGANATETFNRFGADVVSLGYPVDFEGVVENIRITATALDQQERGEQLVTALREKLDAIAAMPPTRVRALYVTPGGVTAGSNTMIDAIFTAAGVVNITAAEGQSFWPPLPAEALLLDPPEFIVAGFFNDADERINYWSAARHPALEAQLKQTPTLHLSADLISCAAWHSVEAAERIADAVQGMGHE